MRCTGRKSEGQRRESWPCFSPAPSLHQAGFLVVPVSLMISTPTGLPLLHNSGSLWAPIKPFPLPVPYPWGDDDLSLLPESGSFSSPCFLTFDPVPPPPPPVYHLVSCVYLSLMNFSVIALDLGFYYS